MNSYRPGEITHLLDEWRSGDRVAFDRLMPLVYDELHKIATGLMHRERSSHTLQPTALLHELYFRLVQQREIGISDRIHFYTFSARLMRMILVDHARGRNAERRGGEAVRVPMSDELAWLGELDTSVLDLERALERLEQYDPTKARIVELRYFLSLNVQEIAETMESSKSTIDRELKFIRGWLYRELHTASPGAA